MSGNLAELVGDCEQRKDASRVLRVTSGPGFPLLATFSNSLCTYCVPHSEPQRCLP